MKGILKRFTKHQGSTTAAHQTVSMITNYNACPLGLALLSRFSSETQSKVLVVSHNVEDVSGSSNQVIGFAAKL